MAAHDHKKDQSTNLINGAPGPVELQYPLKCYIDKVEIVQFQQKQYFEVIEYEAATEETSHDDNQSSDVDYGIPPQIVFIDALSVHDEDTTAIIALIEGDQDIHNQNAECEDIEEVAPPVLQLIIPDLLANKNEQSDFKEIVKYDDAYYDVPNAHPEGLWRHNLYNTGVFQDKLLHGLTWFRQGLHIDWVSNQLHLSTEQSLTGLCGFLFQVVV